MTAEPSPQYALRNTWDRGTLRLRSLEATYDPATRRRLATLGVAHGWNCLEVGAGAGSIARWLGHRVGAGGSVTAVDIDVSALTAMPSNVAIRELDVRVDPLPEGVFDVVHTRLVLNHLAERESVLDKLVAAVRPGGWLLVEEGDTFASGPFDEDEDHTRAMSAWFDVLATVADVQLGRKLPRMFHKRGLTGISVECEVPFAEGGSLEAEWMPLTFDQMNEHAGGGILDAGTTRRWKAKLARPGQWFPTLGLVAARGRAG